MHLLSTLLFISGSVGAFAKVLPRATEPCPHSFVENAPLINNYIVTFRDDHSLDDHFRHIGINLTETATMFHHLKALHAYRAELDERLVHDLIRYDPGVVRVHQGTLLDDTTGAMDHDTPEPPSTKEERPQKSKRWRDFNVGTWDLVVRRSSAFWQKMITASNNTERLETEALFDVPIMVNAGKDVDVYVVDTGVRITHEAFEGRARHFQNKTLTPYTKPEVTMNDTAGHGTHVAGIVAGNGYGVAPWANIVNVKISCRDTTKCNSSDDGVIHAFNDIAEEHKKRRDQNVGGWKGSVVNLSFHLGTSAGLLGALQTLHDVGVPIAAGAGNVVSGSEGLDRIALGPPCSNDNTVCVGAATSRYQVSDISAWGQAVNIWAPGENIVSCGIGSDQSTSAKTGTSQASPQVAGFMAIVVGHEGINNDAATVMARVKANSIPFAMKGLPSIPKMTAAFFTTGINHTKKYSVHPYVDFGVRSKSIKARAIARLKADGQPDTLASTMIEPPSTLVSMAPRGIPSNAGWKNVATSMGPHDGPNIFFQEWEGEDMIATSTETVGPLIEPWVTQLSVVFQASSTSAQPSPTSTGPNYCDSNHVASSCIAGQLPSAAPNTGQQGPICAKADGEQGAAPRLNIQKARYAAAEYCKDLVDHGVVVGPGSSTPALGVKAGEAEGGGNTVVGVMYREANCPADKSITKLDFKAIGLQKCQEYFEPVQIRCGMDKTWAKYNKDFDVQGGFYGKDCGMFALYGSKR